MSNKSQTNKKEFPRSRPYVSKPIPFDMTKLEKEFSRADLQFHGVEHSGVSYEGRIFLNNPNANQDTAKTSNNGYVDSFHVFGHGGCYGDPGHCVVKKERREFDKRSTHPLTPAFIRVVITEGLKQVARNTKEITVTIVPVIKGGNEMCDYENVVVFEKLSLVTYD